MTTVDQNKDSDAEWDNPEERSLRHERKEHNRKILQNYTREQLVAMMRGVHSPRWEYMNNEEIRELVLSLLEELPLIP